MTLEAAIEALTELGVIGVITLGAAVYVAGRLYKRFRS